METINTKRLCERRWSGCRLLMLLVLNLFQEADKAPCTVGEQ
jgi:hypothetical protein